MTVRAISSIRLIIFIFIRSYLGSRIWQLQLADPALDIGRAAQAFALKPVAAAGSKNEKLAARSYIRYYDANGKLRVFYNTYKKSMYGGCMCSFNQVAGMAIPQNQEMLAEQQTP